MKYVYARDNEGFVRKASVDNLGSDEHVISYEEYITLSGDDYYNQHFGQSGQHETSVRYTNIMPFHGATPAMPSLI